MTPEFKVGFEKQAIIGTLARMGMSAAGSVLPSVLRAAKSVGGSLWKHKGATATAALTMPDMVEGARMGARSASFGKGALTDAATGAANRGITV